jgi:glycosyltransferase involved in cell wall biosynthesis
MKVVIVYDVEGWAQHRHALGIQKYAADSVRIMNVTEYNKAWRNLSADVVYCLSMFQSGVPRPSGAALIGLVASRGWMYDAYDPNDWLTRGVTEGRNRSRFVEQVRKYDALICRTPELREFASRYKPSICIPAGVDTAVFAPPSRRPSHSDPFTVGWCGQLGQSRGRPVSPGRNCKGHAQILLPLQEMHPEWQWRVNTSWAGSKLSLPAMVDWYRQCHVFISTGLSEGTPNPPFEAAACGCAVISTDTGQITGWDDLRKMGNILPVPRNGGEAQAAIERFSQTLQGYEHRSHDRMKDGRILRQSVLDHYDYREIAPKVLSFLSSLA